MSAAVLELRPRMTLGARVRAKESVPYASGFKARKGDEGTIASLVFGGAVVGVRWDRDRGVVRATPPKSLEVPS